MANIALPRNPLEGLSTLPANPVLNGPPGSIPHSHRLDSIPIDQEQTNTVPCRKSFYRPGILRCSHFIRRGVRSLGSSHREPPHQGVCPCNRFSYKYDDPRGPQLHYVFDASSCRSPDALYVACTCKGGVSISQNGPRLFVL